MLRNIVMELEAYSGGRRVAKDEGHLSPGNQEVLWWGQRNRRSINEQEG